MRQKTTAKLVLLATTGLLLSILTMFFGTPFLRALRKTYGPIVYWGVGVLFSAIAFPVWFLVGTIWILIGVYDEVERRGQSWWMAGVLSLVLSCSFGFFTSQYTLKSKGIETQQQFEALVGEFTASLEAVSPGLKIKTEDVIEQIPSYVLMTLILALANAIIFEQRVYDWFSLPRVSTGQDNRLIEFRVPNFYVWIALSALLLMAYDFGNKALGIVGENIMNVSAVLYFFQGLAVLESYLRIVRAGFLMRFFTYFIIVGQLFILLSILGLADYWVDFRVRMQKAFKPTDKP